jgi:lipoprotein-anchoring transpeptidase ErfK/SrfK
MRPGLANILRRRVHQHVAHSVLGTLMVLVVVAAITGSAHARALGPLARHAQPQQEVALLTRPHEVVTRMGTHRAERRTLSVSRPITGVRTALPILGRSVTPAGVALLHVMLPGRPNGSLGWIAEEGTTTAPIDWSIIVDIATRQVRVYRDRVLARSFAAIVGKPSTPTPQGRFFVEESVRMLPGAAGGPYALALSAHSDVLRTFEGGQGQVAIHGVENLSGAPGTASSHGCVRLDSRDLTWLVARIRPGVRVMITS